MADCEHLTTTTAYYDGALEPEREAAALEHLATCATCQAVLGDAVAIDAALSSSPRTAAAPVVARKRWPFVMAGGMAIAAAIALYFLGERSPEPREEVAIVLPQERALEVRFTGERFAPHRPYGALRGDRAVETISLADLAKLEKAHATSDLIAALASTGNVGRARELAAGGTGAPGDSDRAALALAANDPEQALEYAYRALAADPALAAAWWNLGLAARAAGLLHVARSAFEHVVERAEAGWADEARAQIAALDRDLAPDRDFAEFVKRAKAMLDGGAPIDVAEVRRFPAYARIHVLDALRVASGARIDELRPLARELDAISGAHTMVAAADRAAAGDPALRARFADRYRTVVARTASSADITKLIDDLRRAGPSVDDIRAGVIIAGSQVDSRLAEITAIAAPWKDPWIDLVVERNRIYKAWPEGDLRAVPALITALDVCTTDAWSLRCGQVAQELAQLLFQTGRTAEAASWATRAVDWYRRGVAPSYVDTARTLLGDIHRNLGRTALGRAELEEVLASTDRCALRRHTSIALAALQFERFDWDGVRRTLPEPTPADGCGTSFEIQAIATAVDLARITRAANDIERGRQWVEAARKLGDANAEPIARIATARLSQPIDPAQAGALREWLVANPPGTDAPWPTAIRTWAFTTLLADAGARGAWSDVLAIAALEHPRATAAHCNVVVSLDDNALTVVARTPAGEVGEHRAIAPRELASITIVPAAITTALASCDEIAVDARSPLHGRADLLPAAMPWWFAGDAPASPAPAGTARALEITNPRPTDSSLPPLPTLAASAERFDVALSGPDATPARVLAALADATYVEIHAHGVTSATDDDAAFLALSPDPDGTFALRAAAVRKVKLARAPIVVLAACRTAVVAPYLRKRWSLPDAFSMAGAHAVVAVDVAIPDASARRVFDQLHHRIAAGEPVHAAVAAIRSAAAPDGWERHMMVFR